MFKIDSEKNIEINRGDRGTIKIKNKSGNFAIGDKIKFSVVNKKDYSEVVLQKTITVMEESEYVYLTLTKEDTTIGDIISKPVKYNYEIEYNGDNTAIGYDEDKGKQFILYPEADTKGSDE